MVNRMPPPAWQSYLGGRVRSLPLLVAEFDLERRSRDAPDTSSERVLGIDVSDGLKMLQHPSLCSSESILKHDASLDWSGVPPVVRSLVGRFLVGQRKSGIPLIVLSLDGVQGRVTFGHLRFGDLFFEQEIFSLRGRLLARLESPLEVSRASEVVLISPPWAEILTPLGLSRA